MDGDCADAGEILLRELAQYPPRRRLEKEPTTQLLEDRCGVMPADAVDDVVDQIVCYPFFGPQCPSVDIADIH